ncbi:MAG: macro domain-containing protein [Deltaproteobacteria bacterium]|jgi:O-acetyl-ADP-ribose deacetylase (regulator of RNase III)|nr:macro domain-containing protein [Deltaproteobacteria bacterium]
MTFMIVRGDVTAQLVDAVVNAANTELRMGGGVCGAIFRAAGPVELKKACQEIGGCETGQAVVTPGFALKAKYVIHTAGPIWQGGDAGEPELLASCYRRSLALAVERGCRSTAFPLLSAGIYGYPRAAALHAAVENIGAFVTENPDFDALLVIFGDELFGLEADERAELAGRLRDVPQPEATARGDWRQLVREAMASRALDARSLAAAANLRPPAAAALLAGAESPSKETLLALAAALESTPRQAADLAASAGQAIEAEDRSWGLTSWFLEQKRFNVHLVNEALFAFGLPLLG